MGKIQFIETDEIEFQRSDRSASVNDAFPDDLLAGVASRVYLAGDDGGLQVFELRYDPNTRVAPHAHAEDEAIYVLEGTIKFGAREFGKGALVSVPGHTLYGFTAGAEGVRFLNFRARIDTTFITPEEHAAARKARSGRERADE